jgi:hypothetical protein
VNSLIYSSFTPKCFGKLLLSSGGLGALETLQPVSVLWAYTDYDPPTAWVASKSPEDGKYLPKHVGVKLEYINKSPGSSVNKFEPMNFFRPPLPTRADQLKTCPVNQKHWLPVVELLWHGLKALICKSTNSDTN